MTNTLENIDKLYKETISDLPKLDRLSYCNKRLDKAQWILEKSSKFLTKDQKKEIKELIESIQMEIKNL